MKKKGFKKFLAMMFAFIMIVSCIGTAGNANAASTDTGNITITGVASDNHTFNAYQIFSGTVAYDASDIPFIGDIVWGSGIDSTKLTTLYTALAAITVDDSGTKYPFRTSPTDSLSAPLSSAAAVAEALEEYGDDADFVQAFMDVISQYLVDTTTYTTSLGSDAGGSYTYTISNVPVGYYLVLDETGTLPQGEAYTSYLAKIVGTNGALIVTKTAETTVEKKIVTSSGDEDVISASAVDTITFKLTGTVSSDLTGYDTYTYKFMDTLSANLEYVEIKSVTWADATAGPTSGTMSEDKANGYSVTVDTTAADGTTALAVAINGISTSKYIGSTITVTYTATLKNTVVAGTTESNSVYIEYSNNPNQGGSGETGTTVTSTVYVNTFDFNVYKTDDSGNALDGAEFTLYKLTSVSQTDFNAGDKTKYYTYSSTDGTMTQCTADSVYSDATDYYVLVDTEETEEGGASPDTYQLATFNDLGEGTYVLVESTTPDGYNTVAPVQFKIVATYDTTDGSVSTLSVTDISGSTHASVAPVSGSTTTIETTIQNEKGSNLPDTGGIGRTIFYILGSILVLGALILLVTRRRMRSEE